MIFHSLQLGALLNHTNIKVALKVLHILNNLDYQLNHQNLLRYQ